MYPEQEIEIFAQRGGWGGGGVVLDISLGGEVRPGPARLLKP